MTCTKAVDEKTKLLSGEEVRAKFYQMLLDQILSVSRSVAKDKDCIAEEMCGKLFWIRDLYIQNRNMAGRCIKDMAARALIPYEFIGRRSDNKSMYRRIGN